VSLKVTGGLLIDACADGEPHTVLGNSRTAVKVAVKVESGRCPGFV
jgi:hypothetical protein